MQRALCASLILFALNAFADSDSIDCSEAYGGTKATCIRVVCDEKYQSFLGTWSGPFQAYVRETSAFRPYQNVVTYSEVDCLQNTETGDKFIIGRRTDNFPAFNGLAAKIEKALLITGKRKDGTPFLRTIDDEGTFDYQLIYQNKPANLSIWGFTVPASQNSPELRFTVIDGQDFSETSVHKRNVTVSMSVGPQTAPVWEGVVGSGYHSLNPKDSGHSK